MATLKVLHARAVENLKQAAAAIEPLHDMASHGQRSALASINETIVELEKVDLPKYFELKKARERTAQFDRLVAGAAKKTTSPDNSLSIAHDLQRMLRWAADSPVATPAMIQAVRISKRRVQDAHRALRLLANPTLRILHGNTFIAAIFVLAIGYAVVYFFFWGAGVERPLTSIGVDEVAASAKSSFAQIKQSIAVNGVIDATKDIIGKLNTFFSVIPLLLAALGVIWAAARKRFDTWGAA